MYKIIFKIVSLFSLISVGLTALPACSSGAGDTLGFAELTSNANKYNGKTVTVEGCFFSGFEIVAFGDSLNKSESGRYTPAGDLIWLTGGLPQNVMDRLYTQTDTPSGYPEHFAKIRLTGVFEYGKTYGHMDAYKYRITITDAVWLDWSPA